MDHHGGFGGDGTIRDMESDCRLMGADEKREQVYEN
jgi:hypothetical protein